MPGKLARQAWVHVREGDVRTELAQCREEGKRLGALAAEGRALVPRLGTPAGQAAARRWLKRTFRVRETGPLAGREPSDLEGIRRLRPAAPRALDADYSPRRLFDRILGAWLGRCCGCYLGKPVEGAPRADVQLLLKRQGRFPLSGYFRPPTLPEALAIKPKHWKNFPNVNGLRFMPEDDDTNYTAIGLAVVRSCGRDFTPEDVAHFWLSNVPYLHTCTAERVAYRNLAAGLLPPESATVGNPYREWIGAQIRADAFGYLAVGRPELAADFAWRDGSISHVKNGIYGEMWVAAMLACAYVLDDPREVVLAGLNEIPADCRLARAIRRMVGLYDRGTSPQRAVVDIHGRWDERVEHQLVHTISNAEVVAYALLWGGGDFGRTICLAVDAALDTDCNGATAGSVAGMMLGAGRMPARWTGQLRDRLKTGVAGYYDVRVSAIARDTADLAAEILRGRTEFRAARKSRRDGSAGAV